MRWASNVLPARTRSKWNSRPSAAATLVMFASMHSSWRCRARRRRRILSSKSGPVRFKCRRWSERTQARSGDRPLRRDPAHAANPRSALTGSPVRRARPCMCAGCRGTCTRAATEIDECHVGDGPRDSGDHHRPDPVREVLEAHHHGARGRARKHDVEPDVARLPGRAAPCERHVVRPGDGHGRRCSLDVDGDDRLARVVRRRAHAREERRDAIHAIIRYELGLPVASNASPMIMMPGI